MRTTRTPPARRATHSPRSRPLAAALALALLVAVADLALAAGGREMLRYQIELAGVQVGRIEVSTEQAADTVAAQVAWTMDGLLGLLEEGRGSLEGRGRAEGDEIEPLDFAGVFEKPDRRREVAIHYAADGGIELLALRNNGRPRRTEVPARLRAGTVDTLTAFWRLQRWAAEGTDSPIEVAVFDGRRRYDLTARWLGPARAELDGRVIEALRVELRLRPRAGFDDDARLFGTRVDPDEPWAEVLVSRDPNPVPLTAQGHGRLAWRIALAGD